MSKLDLITAVAAGTCAGLFGIAYLAGVATLAEFLIWGAVPVLAAAVLIFRR